MSTQTDTRHRPLYEIAAEISAAWLKPYFGAGPYLEAMHSLDQITDSYGCDSADEIVLYLLANANTFKGEKAPELKAELKAIRAGR